MRVDGPGSEAGLGVHIAAIRGRFVVFVAGTIAAGAVAGVVGGADEAPAVKQEACPSAFRKIWPSLRRNFHFSAIESDHTKNEPWACWLRGRRCALRTEVAT